ncbi:MAG: putative redox-active protein (C_GCAxxG_C_C) [Firmicutes bacterium ADurb.Bin300]|nr:MAG: putative redox-active protein (C_GCAxxG_C_C) [Firmicutes bacterium ADurb.Bin300]HOD01818.1 C-GCAxxG-C-C family protein [Clostridiales bacterium]
MNIYSEKAKEYFREGYNCSQSVLLTFSKEIGLDDDIALKLASSFGAGMGRLREVCGAVTAMFMIAGLSSGYTGAGDARVKTQHYQLIQELAGKFKEKNGSIVCGELLGLKPGPDSPIPESRTKEYYKKRPCVELVGDAAEIIGEYYESVVKKTTE